MSTPYVPTSFVGNPTTTQLNAELVKIQDALDVCLLRVDTFFGDDFIGYVNQMEADLDMNGNSILNVETDTNDPNSLVTMAALTNVQGFDASALQAEIDALEVRVNVLEANPGGGTTYDDTAVLASIASLGNQINTLSSDLNTITNQQNSIFAQVQSNDNDIAALNAGQSAQDTDIAALQTATQSNSTDISGLATDIAAVETDIVSLNSQVQSNDADILALQNAPGGGGITTTANGNDLEDVESLARYYDKSYSFYGPQVPDTTTVAGHPIGTLGYLSGISIGALTAPSGGTGTVEVLRNGVVVATITLADGQNSDLVGLGTPALFVGGQFLEIRTGALNGMLDWGITLIFDKIDTTPAAPPIGGN